MAKWLWAFLEQNWQAKANMTEPTIEELKETRAKRWVDYQRLKARADKAFDEWLAADARIRNFDTRQAAEAIAARIKAGDHAAVDELLAMT